MTETQWFLGAAVAIGFVAGWRDLRTGHIPNAITLSALCAAPVGHALVGLADAGPASAASSFLLSVVGAVVCGAVPLLLFRLGAIGGGDVKLLAAIGAVCLPSIGIECVLYGFVVAAVFAPARLAYQGKLLATLGNTLALAANPLLPKARRRAVAPEIFTEMRFGPAAALGIVVGVLLHWSGA